MDDDVRNNTCIYEKKDTLQTVNAHAGISNLFKFSIWQRNKWNHVCLF